VQPLLKGIRCHLFKSKVSTYIIWNFCTGNLVLLCHLFIYLLNHLFVSLMTHGYFILYLGLTFVILLYFVAKLFQLWSLVSCCVPLHPSIIVRVCFFPLSLWGDFNEHILPLHFSVRLLHIFKTEIVLWNPVFHPGTPPTSWVRF
jgi:hypothetical protein